MLWMRPRPIDLRRKLRILPLLFPRCRFCAECIGELFGRWWPELWVMRREESLLRCLPLKKKLRMPDPFAADLRGRLLFLSSGPPSQATLGVDDPIEKGSI
jgi:hypothetical protein